MNFRNSIRIMKKDWNGTMNNKEILAAIIVLPLIFTIALPVIMMIAILADPVSFLADFPGINSILFSLNIPPTYNIYLIAATLMIKMMIIPFFLFIPGFTSSFIATDSFAGEKERKTMETVALLPITKTELIVGKILAAILPSILISSISFLIMGLSVNLILLPHLDGNILIFTDLTNLLIAFVLAPLLGFLFIQITVIISSRSKTVKNAQSVSGSLVIPLMAIFIIQLINPAFLSPLTILFISIIIGALCLLFVKIGSKLLDIERLILTL